MVDSLPKLSWPNAVDKVARWTFRILVAGSSGTGVAIGIGQLKGQKPHGIAIVTARHVVSAIGPGSSLTLENETGSYEFASEDVRFYGLDLPELDTALIQVISEKQIISQDMLCHVVPVESMLRVGASVGWLGYPFLSDFNRCFFQGVISGYHKGLPAYYVDGVAIHGVSGGPLFDDHAQIYGFVSSYIPNRTDPSATMPGIMTAIFVNPALAAFAREFGAIDLTREQFKPIDTTD